MKRSDILLALKAETEEDVITRFPKRYIPLVPDSLALAPQDGAKLVLRGTIVSPQYLRGGQIIRFRIVNKEQREIQAMIFSQPFYRNILHMNVEYFFFGTYRSKRHALMISSVLRTDNPLVLNPYMPYYTLPSKVSQSSFYSYVLEILTNRSDYINEVLPLRYRKKYRLEERYKAFKDVHIPLSEETVKRGLRVFKYEEALSYCLYSLNEKMKASGIKKRKMLPIDRNLVNQFILHLPFKLTHDQIMAVKDIVVDMDSPHVMNRLLEGDVGTGKTIVAFITVYANYLRGGQSALLCPTLTLAEQHYQNALQVFKDYPLQIVLLDTSLSPGEKRNALEKIRNGNADLVIGTHASFSDDVEYKKLTYVIEDEQHKFGVAQRVKMADKGEGTDVLSMSATPIPRTMSMIVNSDMDVSALHEFPNRERKVESKVVKEDDPLIEKAIRRSLEIRHQVFVVAPKIGEGNSSRLSAESVYKDMVNAYGEENVGFLHGRMKKKDQQQVYDDFKNGRKLILVSTSVIEVGVDVSSASLMIVYEANYFGLASLHQLRGRIGRNGKGALALFVYDGEDNEALEKLTYLASHPSGEDIALYDLEQRGGGDLVSERQSGASLLQVANFVNDYQIFKCAREDAEEILHNLDDPQNASYYQSVLREVEKKEEEKENSAKR